MDEDTFKIVNEIFYAQGVLHSAFVNALVNKGLISHEDVRQALSTIVDNTEYPGEIAEVIINGFLDPDRPQDIRHLLKLIEGGKPATPDNEEHQQSSKSPDEPDLE